MYKERYEMLKEAEKTGANISPIDYSFIDWYEKEAVKYTPQNTLSNSDYAKCPCCGEPWNIRRNRACKCGAVIQCKHFE